MEKVNCHIESITPLRSVTFSATAVKIPNNQAPAAFNIYEMLYDDPTVYKYAFDVEDGYEEEMMAFLEDYMENEDPDTAVKIPNNQAPAA